MNLTLLITPPGADLARFWLWDHFIAQWREGGGKRRRLPSPTKTGAEGLGTRCPHALAPRSLLSQSKLLFGVVGVIQPITDREAIGGLT
jgi:hypothetical protein